MATRIVQNIARKPITGEVLANTRISIRGPGVPMFTPTGEVLSNATSYVTTDDTGLWQAVLDILDTGYWSVREAPGVVHLVNPPAGDSTVPVDLEDCIIANPSLPNYPPVSAMVADEIDAMFARSA